MWCSRAVFGPGPKPRQARDGHSWRMAISLRMAPAPLVLPAGPSPLLPARLWWCGEGKGAVTRPEPRACALFALQCVGLRVGPFCPCGLLSPPLRPGLRGGSSAASHASPGWCACALLFAILAVLLECSRTHKVPGSESAVAVPVPSAASRARLRLLAACGVVPVVCRCFVGSCSAGAGEKRYTVKSEKKKKGV